MCALSPSLTARDTSRDGTTTDIPINVNSSPDVKERETTSTPRMPVTGNATRPVSHLFR